MPETEQKKSSKNENADDQNEKVMPFLDHLEELRQRLLICIFSIMLFSIASYFFSKQIMKILLLPYPKTEKLIFLAPTEGFITYIKISVFIGMEPCWNIIFLFLLWALPPIFFPFMRISYSSIPAKQNWGRSWSFEFFTSIYWFAKHALRPSSPYVNIRKLHNFL